MEEEQRLTTNHEEIRQWAEKYNGKPEIIDSPEACVDPIGLRINFPGEGDDVFLSEGRPAQAVSWSEFFEKFEQLQLAFMYDSVIAREDPSLAYHFVRRENAELKSDV